MPPASAERPTETEYQKFSGQLSEILSTRRGALRRSTRFLLSDRSTVGQCDNGYACVYQNNLSWASPTEPLPSEAHPRIVFEMLFGEGGTPQQRQAALKKRASLLDSVTLEIKRIKNRVGGSDRNKIDSYLSTTFARSNVAFRWPSKT